MKLVFSFVSLLWVLSSSLNIPEEMVYLAETMNPEVDEHGNKFFEGDIILNKEQEEIIKDEHKDRSGQRNFTIRWPNKNFVYKIANELAQVTNITTAINNWGKNTCINFTEAGPNDKLFAHFRPPQLGFGCGSELGYQSKEQPIELAYNCRDVGTIEHEIAHALGVYHEQSRSDRDDYVTVLKENIKIISAKNFLKEATSYSYGIPYDLDSVMHYGPAGFQLNQENTLVTNNPFNHFRIGQREGMSFDDIKLVNAMYNCSGKLTYTAGKMYRNSAVFVEFLQEFGPFYGFSTESCVKPPICQNQGFVNNKCLCVCPPGTSGSKCENGRRTFPVNSCQYDLSRANRIMSPGFPDSRKPEKCVWRITAPQGQKVSITFPKFHVGTPLPDYIPLVANWCDPEYLELRLKDQIRGTKYCGNQLLNKTMTSTNNIAVLVYYNVLGNYEGFQADVRFI